MRLVSSPSSRRNISVHLLGDAIEADHFAEAIAKSVPMRLGEVVHLVFAGVEAARRHGVQQWLPETGTGTFDQGDGSPPAPADAIAELRDELEARRAAANHHDAVQDLLIGILIRARCDDLRIWIIPVQGHDIALTVQNLVHSASPAYTGRYTRARIKAATSSGRGTRARPWSKM
jgi:hypothetical protein